MTAILALDSCIRFTCASKRRGWFIFGQSPKMNHIPPFCERSEYYMTAILAIKKMYYIVLATLAREKGKWFIFRAFARKMNHPLLSLCEHRERKAHHIAKDFNNENC
jgi:hypothetical protein